MDPAALLPQGDIDLLFFRLRQLHRNREAVLIDLIAVIRRALQGLYVHCTVKGRLRLAVKSNNKGDMAPKLSHIPIDCGNLHGYRRSVSRPCRASWKQERKNQCKEHSDASFSHMIHPIALKFSLFTSKSIFSFTWNTVPFKSLVTEMVPPCISTIFFTMASPKPVPPVAVDRDCSTR